MTLLRNSWILIASVFIVSCGSDIEPGFVEGLPRSDSTIKNLEALHKFSLKDEDEFQILFGDLHVHTSYSIDAFTLELPMMGLQGIHDSGMACDFARYCANLDFFSFNDHAESLTPEHWQEQQSIINQCNIPSESGGQDLVVFPGWEWTQVGTTKDNHWGHRNVIFRSTSEIPPRPIGSRHPDSGLGIFNATRPAIGARYIDPLNFKRYSDLGWLLDTVESIPFCDPTISSKDLPMSCYEFAKTPRELFSKIDEWGFDSIVIPHGTTWGFHVPYNTSWDSRLNEEGHDPSKQILLEIMSGHGNSEEYRNFIAVDEGADGLPICPEFNNNFLPSCQRASELMMDRCQDLSDSECEARIKLAKRFTIEAGPYSNMVFPEAQPEEWLDANQCRDCFKPSFNYRPKQSGQYALAITNFDSNDFSRYKFGFIASTDDHTARPGTGYKQYERRKMTFSTGVQSPWFDFKYKAEDPNFPEQPSLIAGESQPDSERNSSFTYPGGIVGVHARSRSKEDIWEALKNKRTYGTSGPRMLLWFELLTSNGESLPMGSELTMIEAPTFKVKAAGSYKQKPGCPSDSVSNLSNERLDYLCAGECYNPSDERYSITRIEVIKITPQEYRGERIADLINDAWKTIECPKNNKICEATFTDNNYIRDSVYYVRAIQEGIQAINGKQIVNNNGDMTKIKICKGGYQTNLQDDCLYSSEERAWSSPIFINKP
jgi:hypothetical protein